MKASFKISIAANLLLAALVCWLLHSPVSKIEGAARNNNSAPPTIASPQPMPASMAPPFRWGQLESTDYRTYIANLRGIQCPEQTVRDIITADVDEAYFLSSREQLRQSPGSQYALQQLQGQETALINSLLSNQPDRSLVAAGSQAPPAVEKILRVKSQAEREFDRPISIPLVLAPLDTANMKLNDFQQQTISEIRQNFLDEIGGSNQDPNDPAYRRRWQAAQREADDMLVGLLGRNFTLNLQAQLENSASATN